MNLLKDMGSSENFGEIREPWTTPNITTKRFLQGYHCCHCWVAVGGTTAANYKAWLLHLPSLLSLWATTTLTRIESAESLLLCMPVSGAKSEWEYLIGWTLLMSSCFSCRGSWESKCVASSSPLVECGLWSMSWGIPKPRKGFELRSIQRMINDPYRDTWSKLLLEWLGLSHVHLIGGGTLRKTWLLSS